MKKLFSILFFLLLIVGLFAAWRLFGSNTNFTENKKALYIKTGSSFDDVMKTITDEELLKNPLTFKWVAQQLDYDKKVKAGKYVIDKGASIFTIIKALRSGRQTPVNLVINKLRTKEDLAKKIASGFEVDSAFVMHWLESNDSLKQYGLDTNTAMTAIIPNTYSILWNTSFQKIFKKLYDEQELFWNEKREKEATALNLTKKEVYILASIVEEETNQNDDKGKIASVYMNRLKEGMRLGADPTVKFAMNDFSIKRIYQKYTMVESPYNTYRNSGLPPGPICTPSQKTIDAVLAAPSTSYLYFVAQPNLSGFHTFANTYEEHMKNAKIYQAWLSEFMKQKDSLPPATSSVN